MWLLSSPDIARLHNLDIAVYYWVYYYNSEHVQSMCWGLLRLHGTSVIVVPQQLGLYIHEVMSLWLATSNTVIIAMASVIHPHIITLLWSVYTLVYETRD